MSSKLAKQAVALYRTRMQIEEEFRDMKSRLYGLGFEQNNSKLQRRLAVLILITTLACLVALLIGLTVISAGLHRRYQANTAKKRVLSYQFLGRRAVMNDRIRLLKSDLMDAIAALKHGILRAIAHVQ
jgi:cell division protein FtsB